MIRGPRGGLPGHFVRGAHGNASGDYLCVSKASWRAVGGYSEDPGAVLHTDALLVAQLLGANLSQVIYAKPGALLHEDHPRASDEEPGCRAAAWPAFLERMQSIIDSRCSPRLNVGPIGLEHLELPISTIN